MRREEYNNELRKLQRMRKFKGNRLPTSVFNYGWEIAKGKSQAWMVARIIFWAFSYDKTHRWTNRDFDYVVDEASYEKAKKHIEKRRKKSAEYFKEKHNRPRPIPEPTTSWAECNNGLQKALDSLGFNDIQEALNGGRKGNK